MAKKKKKAARKAKKKTATRKKSAPKKKAAKKVAKRRTSRKSAKKKAAKGKAASRKRKPAKKKKATKRKTKARKPKQPPLLFISYSHVDEECRKRLRIHLKPLERAKVLRVFDDTELARNTGWEEQLKKKLREAELIILLVSPDFLASQACFEEEWPIAQKRWKSGRAIVTFALIHPCQWIETEIGKLQGVPAHGDLLPDDKRGTAEFWDRVTTKLRHDAINCRE